MLALVVVAVIFLILIGAEYLSRKKGLHAELSRKLIHVSAGTFAAFWPFFLSWHQIQILSIIFLVGMVLSVRLHLFRSIHDVERTAAGEILAVTIVALLSFITTSEWVFMAAMLHLSLADGFAAIVGVLYGEKNSYKILGEVRSLAGSLAFFFVSIGIMVCYAAFSGQTYSSVTVLWLPVAATIVENVAVRGSDNVAIPLLVAFVLTSAF
jgi:dolichol kinase